MKKLLIASLMILFSSSAFSDNHYDPYKMNNSDCDDLKKKFEYRSKILRKILATLRFYGC